MSFHMNLFFFVTIHYDFLYAIVMLIMDCLAAELLFAVLSRVDRLEIGILVGAEYACLTVGVLRIWIYMYIQGNTSNVQWTLS